MPLAAADVMLDSKLIIEAAPGQVSVAGRRARAVQRRTEMETQVEYETELTLAAFRSPEQADEAFRRLEALGLSSTDITRVTLGPGRYQTKDITFEEENAGVRARARSSVRPSGLRWAWESRWWCRRPGQRCWRVWPRRGPSAAE